MLRPRLALPRNQRLRGAARTSLIFFTATISPVSLLRHLSTMPYAPSPTMPSTSYLFMVHRRVRAGSRVRDATSLNHAGRAAAGWD